jgi:hypothetical protein
MSLIECSKRNLCDDVKCTICFNKSFASSDRAKYWSDKNPVSPRTVFKCSGKKFIFNCDTCSKEFTSILNNITNKGSWCKPCGYVSSREKQSMKLEEFIILARNKHGDTYDYFKVIMNGADINIIIICKIHGEFSQTPHAHLQGNGCPQCGINRAADSCRDTLDEFIAKAKEVHKNKYSYPKFIYIDSKTPGMINCMEHGEFSQTPKNHLQGQGCPQCGTNNLTEIKLYEWLKSIYPNAVKGYKADWCINPLSGRYLPYDFIIPDKMTIIELDGNHHFKQVSNWDNPLYTMKRDIFKMQMAKDNGYKIIRIYQPDVYKNNNEWLNENLLSEINNSDRTDIFISSIENIYDEHIKLIETGVIVLDSSDSSEENTNSET